MVNFVLQLSDSVYIGDRFNHFEWLIRRNASIVGTYFRLIQDKVTLYGKEENSVHIYAMNGQSTKWQLIGNPYV